MRKGDTPRSLFVQTCTLDFYFQRDTDLNLNVVMYSGAVRWHPLHPTQPDGVLEVHGEHVGPADRLPLQPRLHGPPGAAQQRADLGASGWGRHQHAVTAQLCLVREPVARFKKSLVVHSCHITPVVSHLL